MGFILRRNLKHKTLENGSKSLHLGDETNEFRNKQTSGRQLYDKDPWLRSTICVMQMNTYALLYVQHCIRSSFSKQKTYRR